MDQYGPYGSVEIEYHLVSEIEFHLVSDKRKLSSRVYWAQISINCGAR
jgi:hypothetical protein